MNYNELTIRFLKSVRGDLSQPVFSDKLGYKFNVSNRWENLLRHFYWSDFIVIAKKMSWPLDKILEGVTHFSFSPFPDAEEIFKTLYVSSSAPLLNQHFSKQRRSRLLSGSSKMRFDELLMIIDVVYGRVERFFELLHHPFEFSGAFDVAARYRAAITNDPSLILVKNAMYIGEFRKQKSNGVQFLSDLLKMPIESVRQKLQILVETGIATNREGIFKLSQEPGVDIGVDLSTTRSVASFLRQRIAIRAQVASENEASRSKASSSSSSVIENGDSGESVRTGKSVRTRENLPTEDLPRCTNGGGLNTADGSSQNHTETSIDTTPSAGAGADTTPSAGAGADTSVRQAYLLYATDQDLEDELFKLARQFYIDARNLVKNWDKSKTDRLGYLAIDLMQDAADPKPK